MSWVLLSGVVVSGLSAVIVRPGPLKLGMASTGGAAVPSASSVTPNTSMTGRQIFMAHLRSRDAPALTRSSPPALRRHTPPSPSRAGGTFSSTAGEETSLNRHLLALRRTVEQPGDLPRITRPAPPPRPRRTGHQRLPDGTVGAFLVQSAGRKNFPARRHASHKRAPDGQFGTPEQRSKEIRLAAPIGGFRAQQAAGVMTERDPFSHRRGGGFPVSRDPARRSASPCPPSSLPPSGAPSPGTCGPGGCWLVW